MSLKNILAAYSGKATRGAALRHAVKLALHHGAHITGVLRHGRPLLERRFARHIPDHLFASLHEADARRIAEISARFSDITAQSGLEGRAEFIDLTPDQGQSLPEFARSFDLVVTGTHSDDADEAHLASQPDLIALQSGRPVLVVPDGYDSSGLASHALVAWDGKRSAARALGDAMPGLEHKARVTVLCVGDAPVAGTEQLIANLARHGIHAGLRTVPRKGRTGDTILAAAQDLGAGLIVMGAFEHSKFAHDVFGGVTTDVIRDAKVPVFMSH
jgi:nucleotide-binding universal stress UspA family protein